MRLRSLLLGLVLLASACVRTSLQTCKSDSDCASYGAAVCNMKTLTCWRPPGSEGDAGVPGDAGFDLGPLNGHDLASPPTCDASSECTSPLEPVCGATSMCRPCVGDSDNATCAAHDPKTPRCDATNHGICAACRPDHQATDCPSVTPICPMNGDGSCRKCQAHSECPSGVCIMDGANAGMCASTSDIAYVDNGGTTAVACAMIGTHDGSSATTAFCDIQSAIANSSKPYVLVKGHLGASYGATADTAIAVTTARTVTVIGPGLDSDQPATIFNLTSPDVTVNISGAGVMAYLVLDGLEIGDRVNPTTQMGIRCVAGANATAKITLRRATLQRNGQGLSATGCDITTDGVIVGPNNTAGGISLNNSDATLVNTLVDNNGTGGTAAGASGFGGIVFSGSGSTGRAQVINVTVVENQAKATTGVYSGIDCVTGANPTIINTVVNGNSNTQINSACALAYSAYAGAGTTNHNLDLTSCTDAMLFTNPTMQQFQPKTTAMSPCLITLIGGGTANYTVGSTVINAPDHDLTGASRPQPAMTNPDVGAYEVSQ